LFEVEDFDDAVLRAKDFRAEILLGPVLNPAEGELGAPALRELWLRDVNGYLVSLCSPDGEAIAESEIAASRGKIKLSF
jgi:hypothetical protein